MAWTLTDHIDRGTTETIQNPSWSAFGVAFMSFFAGGELVYHFTKGWHSPSIISVAGDFVVVTCFLGIALERGYFLARAIRQLRNSRHPSSAC